MPIIQLRIQLIHVCFGFLMRQDSKTRTRPTQHELSETQYPKRRNTNTYQTYNFQCRSRYVTNGGETRRGSEAHMPIYVRASVFCHVAYAHKHTHTHINTGCLMQGLRLNWTYLGFKPFFETKQVSKPPLHQFVTWECFSFLCCASRFHVPKR